MSMLVYVSEKKVCAHCSSHVVEFIVFTCRFSYIEKLLAIVAFRAYVGVGECVINQFF